MATGLVKWCRARFLAGYKPFSVVGGGAEGSDAEELLAGVTAPCSSSPPPPPPPPPPLLTPPESPTAPTPPIVNEDQTNSHATRQLSFEEFECDVSVAEGDRRRQEFSFTLYDFDGHGKITKDDIAGLVTTIYDTLGASIQVPPCGSKTIKVKLTVSPDPRSGQAHITPIKTANLPQSLPAPTPCCHVKHVTSCSHVKHASRRVPRRRRVQRHRCQSEHGVDSPTEDDARNAPPASQSKQEELRRRVGPVPHLPSPYSNSSEGDVSEDSDASPLLTPLRPLIPNQRKRSGAMQRQQLLEIIQANMEKNNLSFHATRKRHQNEHARIPLRSPYTEPSSPYIQRCRPQQTARQTAYHKPVREHPHHPNSLPDVPSKPRGNGRKQRAHHSPQTPAATTHPAESYVANGTAAATATATAAPQVAHTVTQNLTTSATQNNNNSNATNTHASVNNQIHSNNTHANNQRNETHIHPPHGGGKPGKKHQLKHATREQDQARAMAQVVRWLEREFSQGAAAAAAGRRHVHEHIHHHYHHYHAEALV